MSNVEFDESSNVFTSRRILGEEIVPGMVKGLQKMGVVKSPAQAKYILVGIALTSTLLTILILSFFVFRNGRGGSPSKPINQTMPSDHPPYLKPTL